MSRHPGVSWHSASGKWCAYANFLGKRCNLGLYAEQSEALAAVRAFKVANDIETDELAPIASRVEFAGAELVWRQHGRGHEKGAVVGSVDKVSGYRFARDMDGKKVYLHRLVWQMLRGPIPAGMEIDHINGDRSDNAIANLRVVSRSINLKNQRTTRRNSTGHRGVSELPNGQFLARIWLDGRPHRIGVFATAELAGAARLAAEPAYGYHPNHGSNAA